MMYLRIRGGLRSRGSVRCRGVGMGLAHRSSPIQGAGSGPYRRLTDVGTHIRLLTPLLLTSIGLVTG